MWIGLDSFQGYGTTLQSSSGSINRDSQRDPEDIGEF